MISKTVHCELCSAEVKVRDNGGGTAINVPDDWLKGAIERPVSDAEKERIGYTNNVTLIHICPKCKTKFKDL